MKDLWNPQAVLVNVSVSTAIEAGRAAFVPPEDPRVCAIDRQHPVHAQFLKRFTDSFGKRVRPTVLLLSPPAGSTYETVNSVASIRDALSMSVVPGARARQICTTHGPGIYFSSAFDFYPWMLDRDYEGLINHTPAVRGWNDVEQFRGQPSPGIVVSNLRYGDLDTPVWTALIQRWTHAYGTNEPTDGALMRSLNMAHHACQLPANQDTRHFDYGRQIALWVSAFEILAHPQTEQVNKSIVCDLLDRAHWTAALNSTKSTEGEGNPGGQRSLPSQLYLLLFAVRNKYLHGNPVTPESLQLPGGEGVLGDFAAPLYRMALTAFLSLGPPDVESLTPESAEQNQPSVESITWDIDSQDFEAAIMRSCVLPGFE